MKTLAAAALCAELLAGCGGSGADKPVAHVGGEAITQKQLDAVVDHFRTETEHEGSRYPKEGTREFAQLRNQLLDLLVYRVELRQAARRLGVEADPNEIAKRLAAGDEDEGDDDFARDSVEAQLLIEGIYATVTRGVTGATAAETIARKNHRWTAFLKRLQHETHVRYEPGYTPRA
jgi:SurA N-terminal domain